MITEKYPYRSRDGTIVFGKARFDKKGFGYGFYKKMDFWILKAD